MKFKQPKRQRQKIRKLVKILRQRMKFWTKINYKKKHQMNNKFRKNK